MKKVIILVSLALVLGLVIGCPQPTDSGNGGGGKVYVKPADVTVYVGKGDTIPMQIIGIKGGTFTMGNADETILYTDNERPVHSVTLNSFYLGATEVTEAQWEAVMGGWPKTNPSPEPNPNPNHPARYINWYDAIRFCNKLSKSEGLDEVYYIGGEYNEMTTDEVTNTDATFANESVKMDITKNGYRLPTEAEWEYAAGGAKERPTTWAGTSVDSELPDYAVYGGSNLAEVKGDRSPVSETYALYDMSGNVVEWCWDSYDANYYWKNGNDVNPEGPDSVSARVVRGGDWNNSPSDVRVSKRFNGAPSIRNDGAGFRVARSVE